MEQSRQELIASMWRSIYSDLENTRARIHGEITAYPAPIPACDADFNYLLEARAKILHEMDIARTAAGTPGTFEQAAQAIKRFAAASNHVSEKTRRALGLELEVCNSVTEQQAVITSQRCA